MKFPHTDLMRTAGPFDTWMQREDVRGTAMGRFQKAELLDERIMSIMLAKGRTRSEALRARIRINLLLEEEMSTLLDNQLLEQWCDLWVKHNVRAGK
jgi:hypothetical protein